MSLVIEDLQLRFGGVVALAGVSLLVQSGELAAIIGPNGAGKTSLLNSISGLYVPQHGHISWESRPVLGARPHQLARLGIARTFQNLGLFAGLRVVDNLLLGRHVHLRAGLLGGGLYWGAARQEEARHRAVVDDLLAFLELEHVRAQPVGTLAYGLQKRVELGRALAQEPRLLLLDEPMAGMNVEEKQHMVRFILEVHASRGMTIVMIEHDMGVVMDISQRIHVLDFGRKIADGTPDDIRANSDVIQAYLGQDRAA